MSAWADDDRQCYETSLGVIERAARFIAARDRGDRTFGGQRHRALPDAERHRVLVEILPWLRGRVGGDRRSVATVQDDAKMLRFVCSLDGPRLAALGTSCPDHFLRTKIKPLFVDWDPERADTGALEDLLAAGLERYREDYAAYYDASKAAANHLVRELAIELAPLIRVNAVAPATVVTGSTMFPRDRVIASLVKYEIAFHDGESTEELRSRLATFYARRTLTGARIEPEDQAEALYLLLTRRLAKTTGHVLPVDGGLQDGFLR